MSNTYQAPLAPWKSGVASYSKKGTLSLRQLRADHRDTPTACCSFIFDDGFATDLTLIYPVFAAAGVLGSTAVTTNYIGTSGKMSLAQLTELAGYGWEILSHQQDHITMTGVTDESVIEAQIADSKTVLEGLGFTVESYVACYNASTALARKWVSQYYRAGFSHTPGGGMDGINIIPINTYRLIRIDITDTEAEDIAAYEAYIDDAATRGGWVVFYMHQSTSTHASMIADLIAYCATKNVDVVTPSVALDRFENVFEYGDLDEGTAVIMGPDGIVRMNTIYVCGELRLGSDTYPWNEAYAADSLDAGNRVLNAQSSSYDVIVDEAGAIRPVTTYTHANGEWAYAWSAIYGKKFARRTAYAPKALSDVPYETGVVVSSGAAKDVTISIGANCKILAVSLRVATAITGPTTFDAEWVSGVGAQNIADDAAVASGTVVTKFFDESAASAITTGNPVIRFTANGGNFAGGQINTVVWYQAFTDS